MSLAKLDDAARRVLWIVGLDSAPRSYRGCSVCRKPLRLRNGTQLTQQPYVVAVDPMFGQLAINDAINHDPGYGDCLSGRRNAHARTFVSSSSCCAGHYLVLFSYDIIEGDVPIGKRGVSVDSSLNKRLDALGLTLGCVVVDIVVCD